MKINAIDTHTGLHSTQDTDTLAARVRRTAIAGAAAVALTGGGMVSANAATEVVAESSAAEENWKRMGRTAAKQSGLSMDRAAQVIADAADKKAELVMALTVERKQTKALMDASDAVLKAEGNFFQRGLDQAEKRLDKARANLSKATQMREATQARHESLAQEKANATLTLWQNAAAQLTAAASNQEPTESLTVKHERTFTDASGLSTDDFFKRIDDAIARGKENNAKMAAELDKPAFLKQKDHEIAKAKRALELLKSKQKAKLMVAKAPLVETASALGVPAPAPAIAEISEVAAAATESAATATPAVVMADASDSDWRTWLDDKTREIKEGAETTARIVETSEHATDEEKVTTRQVLTEVIETLEQELGESSGDDGKETNPDDVTRAGVDSTDTDVGDNSADTVVGVDESIATESPAEPTESEALVQPVDPAVQTMAAGVVLTQMANAAQQNADLFRKGMQDRLSGDDAFMQPTDIASATSGISTWAQAMGGQTTGQARGDVAGFSMRGAGMVAGIDAKKNNTRVGVAVGYGDASVDANGANSQNASSKVSTYSVGLYGAHEVDGWFANGGVSYSAHSIKSQRTAKLGGEVYGLSGKTSATTIGGFAQFGKHIVTRAVNIDPSVTLKVSNTSVKGFTEHGEAGLKVDGSQFNSARVGIGARLWKEFGDESHSITPSLRIAYERELAHAAPSMDVAVANAANAGTMTVTGHKLGRDIVSAEAGIDVKFGKKLSLRGGVNGSLRQGQTQAGVAGSLKYVW